jgi:hypothetical protein
LHVVLPLSFRVGPASHAGGRCARVSRSSARVFWWEISRGRRVARLAKTPRSSPASWRPVFWRSEFQPVGMDPELPGARGSGGGDGRTRGTASRPTRRPPVPTPERRPMPQALAWPARRSTAAGRCGFVALWRQHERPEHLPSRPSRLAPSAARRHQDRAPAGGEAVRARERDQGRRVWLLVS